MKEKIKKIKFIKKEAFLQNFRIEANADQENEQVDISVHESGIPEGKINRETKIYTGKKSLKIKVNELEKEEVIDYGVGGEKTIIRRFQLSSGSINEAIYQFSVPFQNIQSRDNIVQVQISQELLPETGQQDLVKTFRLVGDVEFFAEMDDNFINVRLDRSGSESTKDQTLWKAIRRNLKFQEYSKFMDSILCNDDDVKNLAAGKSITFTREQTKSRSPFVRSDQYNLIKFGTEFYMLAKFGLDESEIENYIGTGKMLPYYGLIADRLKDDLKFDDKTLAVDKLNQCETDEYNRLHNPFMIELIWNYWMEQAGLVQTLNIINLRFQNIKGSNVSDRLQRFDIDPLRPLSHILWGYIQDEQHRLSIPRRLNEYDHEYGLTLTGRAVPNIRPIDSRVQFLEAFHSLLNQALVYYHESDDTTRIADAFPILNSLKEVHLLLAEGNHNAYGNLTWTARQEMMMQQYILSRHEMRDFLGGRTMVPYPETWMDRVDNMRNIQGWSGAGVMSYYELAVHGEQILLAIRYGNWSDIDLTGDNAANWAKEFRNSIQRYVHAYRAVTGVDLSADRVQLTQNFATQPAFLIQQRMQLANSQMRRA